MINHEMPDESLKDTSGSRFAIQLIHPDSGFVIYWGLFVISAAVFAAIEIPLILVFNYKEGLLLIGINWFVTLIFIIDVFINFNMAVYTKGVMITDRRFIAKRYLKSWFIVDLIAAFPFSFLRMCFSLSKMFRLIRIIKSIRMFDLVHKINRSRINPAILRLFFLIFWVLLLAHLIACGWIAINGLNPEIDHITQYIRAYYWTITTLTTIGYGDITPDGNLQTVFVIFIELIGAGIYGLIIGNIANLVANIDVAKTQFKKKMETINTFLKYRDIPDQIQKKVNQYYNYLWETRGGHNDAQILHDFPLSLKTDISLFLNKDIIEKVPLFEGTSKEFINEIILNLTPVVFTPNDNIVTAGEVGNDMFFISKGSVDVLSKNEKHLYATLSVGQFFGEMALLLKTPRTATIKAKEFCDLYQLDKYTFERILAHYPEFRENIRKLAKERKKELDLVKSDSKINAIDTYESRGIRRFEIKIEDQKVHLAWEPNHNAEGYDLIKKYKISEKWVYLKKGFIKHEYVDNEIKIGARHFYKVRAVFESEIGPWTKVLVAKFEFKKNSRI